MDKSPFDYAVDITLERQKVAVSELHQRFKRKKPFRREPVSKDEIAYYLSQITPEERQSLRQTQGDKVADDFEIFRQKNIRGKE